MENILIAFNKKELQIIHHLLRDRATDTNYSGDVSQDAHEISLRTSRALTTMDISSEVDKTLKWLRREE